MGKKTKSYGFDNRKEFVKLILSMRKGKNKTTYKGIANHLHENGYRNRDDRKITPQFVGNILNRWTENGKSLA